MILSLSPENGDFDNQKSDFSNSPPTHFNYFIRDLPLVSSFIKAIAVFVLLGCLFISVYLAYGSYNLERKTQFS